ncbi:hypothetical protein IG631_15458 [Alternaria alternata]|nr:hypothetical protein IG631_15458 [Alternaria alternata]
MRRIADGFGMSVGDGRASGVNKVSTHHQQPSWSKASPQPLLHPFGALEVQQRPDARRRGGTPGHVPQRTRGGASTRE